jgi:hypothetical protein
MLGSANILPGAKTTQPLDENTPSTELKMDRPSIPKQSAEVQVMGSSLNVDKPPFPVPSIVEVKDSSPAVDKPFPPVPSIEVEVMDSSLNDDKLPPPAPSTEIEAMDSSLELVKLPLPEPSIEVKLTYSSQQFADEPHIQEPSTEVDVMDSSLQADEDPPIPMQSTEVEEMDSSMQVDKDPSIRGPSNKVMDSSPKQTPTVDGCLPPIASMHVSSDGCGCYMLTNKIQVYPHNSDMAIPEGATVLPISDDEWVAVSLPFSNNGGMLNSTT